MPAAVLQERTPPGAGPAPGPVLCKALPSGAQRRVCTRVSRHVGDGALCASGFILGVGAELCSRSVFLQKLFGFLLEYIGDLATDDPPDLRVIDKLVV